MAKKKNLKNVRRLCVRDSARDVWSSVWRIWTSKDDIYVSYSAAKSSIKVSLHASGRWRFGYESDEIAQAAGRAPGSDRAVAKWQRPAPLIPGVTQAMAIRIPTSELRSVDAGQAETRWALWCEPGPPESAVYFSVFINDTPEPDDWPGKRAMPTMLVGRLPLTGGREVQVTGHSEDLPPEFVQAMEEDKRHLFEERWHDFAGMTGATYRGHMLHGVAEGKPVITDVAFDVPTRRPGAAKGTS
jgi:hypothetical protein